MIKYVIWDKVSPIVTPSGAMYTAEQWMDQYPVARTDAHILCADGFVNGAVFAILEQMVDDYTRRGCDFTGCEVAQDYLDKIEEYDELMEEERAREEEAAREQAHLDYEASILDNKRIADALEDLVVLNMPDIEEV